MADNLGEGIRNLLLAGIGAVATTAEKSKEIVDSLIKKGELTVEQGKTMNEELKRKVRSACADAIDVKRMTPEERGELRRKLDECDAQGDD